MGPSSFGKLLIDQVQDRPAGVPLEDAASRENVSGTAAEEGRSQRENQSSDQDGAESWSRTGVDVPSRHLEVGSCFAQ